MSTFHDNHTTYKHAINNEQGKNNNKNTANHIAKLHNEIQECTNKQHETNDVTHMMQLNDATHDKNRMI